MLVQMFHAQMLLRSFNLPILIDIADAFKQLPQHAAFIWW